jgi:hypothetical protein
MSFFRVLKRLAQTLLVLVAVAVAVGLTYFLTIFGGIAILGLLVFIVISEYYREPKEKEGD